MNYVAGEQQEQNTAVAVDSEWTTIVNMMVRVVERALERGQASALLVTNATGELSVRITPGESSPAEPPATHRTRR